ncbi:MAG TPA: DUF2617 family protein [Micromonosporaceae bacterium]
MLVTLDTPYADTTAADLSFALGLPELPALHVRDLAVTPGGARLRLRLLGASHQVVLWAASDVLVETVACLPGRSACLPSAVDEQTLGYRFSARVQRLAPARLSARVARLREQLTDNPYALIGVFPGSPDAVTALCAWRTQTMIGWRTWHAYPQTRELVVTETGVKLR